MHLMSQSPLPTAGERLPRWAVWLGSAAIAYHLFAVVIGALMAPSGPWPSMEGMSLPPQLVRSIDEPITRPYLKLVKLTHNYHFGSNRPAMEAAELEFQLLDGTGKEIKTVR